MGRDCLFFLLLSPPRFKYASCRTKTVEDCLHGGTPCETCTRSTPCTIAFFSPWRSGSLSDGGFGLLGAQTYQPFLALCIQLLLHRSSINFCSQGCSLRVHAAKDVQNRDVRTYEGSDVTVIRASVKRSGRTSVCATRRQGPHPSYVLGISHPFASGGGYQACLRVMPIRSAARGKLAKLMT